MTKEELKQEAEEKCVCTDEAMRIMYRIGYIDGAEPREKRIAELEDKLANADYQLEGRDNEIAELEEQIEKMKCCANCKKYWCMCEYGDKEMQICEKWEIKEK